MSSPDSQIRIDPSIDGPQPAVSTRFLSLLAGYIDQLVQATDRRDWVSVGRLSVALAEGSAEAGLFELSGAAQQLATAARVGTSSANTRRALLRLIGVYGRIRRARTACMTI